MSASLDQELRNRLSAIDAAGLRRVQDAWGSPQAPLRRMPPGEYLNFSSNDYLGLANHPRVCSALSRGAARWGCGTGAAHLLGGHTTEHAALEEELAGFVGRQRALLFGSGYLANVGVIGALVERGDAIFQDRLNHASLIDGALGSRAAFKRYRHADVGQLAELLAADSARHRLVVTDGVFSMDGDVAPLEQLATVCRERDAWLMVDDAHGLGVLGDTGAGSVAGAGLSVNEVPVFMATLGKALGTAGAFVAGSDALIDYLIQRARTFVYSTAAPAAVAAATREALRVVQEEPQRRERLHELMRRFRAGAAQAGLPLLPSSTPIQPLLLGGVERLLVWRDALREAGILVGAIRPPTVPRGTARLRITLTAAHTAGQVDRLLETLAAIASRETTAGAQVPA
ncbi:MAG: 8-amino-7-oxononanoate synthase [Pseudomonadota bacterium]|nr:8-amino-7-oxononanoate synthase [Pseudomonadota bacterium]